MATEELKAVTVFLAGLGGIDMRTRMPHDEIVKEMRGETENAHPIEACFLGVDEVDNEVTVNFSRHNILGYVIRKHTNRSIAVPQVGLVKQ